MSARSTENQLERMARELIAVAKALNCSVHLDVAQYDDGTYGGVLYKIKESAASFDFMDGKIDFTGLVEDRRHLTQLERQDKT